MRGGRRLGSGRKPGIPSVVVRVPRPCLDEVRTVISRFRMSLVKSVTAIETDSSEDQAKLLALLADSSSQEAEIKPEQESVTENKYEDQPPAQPARLNSVPLTDDQKRIRKSLERLPKAAQRKIKAEHGTLTQAVIAGVVLDGHGGAVWRSRNSPGTGL